MNKILSVQGNSTPALYGAGAGGSKGVNAVSPSPDVCGAPTNVAGPLSGTGKAPSGDIPVADQRRRGRPASGKAKMRFSFSPGLTSRLHNFTNGARGRTVANAVTLFLDGPGMALIERVSPELWNLFIRLRQVRGFLATGSALSVEKQARVEAFGAAVLCILERILGQFSGAGKPPSVDPSILEPAQGRRGKPTSGDSVTKLSFSAAVTNRLRNVPKGMRRRTVEIAVGLFLDGPDMEWLERVYPELLDISILLQHVLETLADRPALTVEKQARAVAIGAAAITKLGRIFEI